MTKNDPVAARRNPQQARAEHTVQAIFEATAQVLHEHGAAGLTTNRIAARAGVSIGTLYQYFGSKEAIVLAILERARKRLVRELDALISAVSPNPSGVSEAELRGVLRAYIRLYIASYGTGTRNERELLRLAWSLDRHELLVLALRETSEHIAMHLQRLQHPLIREPSSAMLFVMTRALAGVVRAAALEESPLLGTEALEDELVSLCWSLLRVASA